MAPSCRVVIGVVTTAAAALLVAAIATAAPSVQAAVLPVAAAAPTARVGGAPASERVALPQGGAPAPAPAIRQIKIKCKKCEITVETRGTAKQPQPSKAASVAVPASAVSAAPASSLDAGDGPPVLTQAVGALERALGVLDKAGAATVGPAVQKISDAKVLLVGLVAPAKGRAPALAPAIRQCSKDGCIHTFPPPNRKAKEASLFAAVGAAPAAAASATEATLGGGDGLLLAVAVAALEEALRVLDAAGVAGVGPAVQMISDAKVLLVGLAKLGGM
ncbi:hypothetical protein BU14_0292s0012 [Porphyra umbilicalis]|uniref:Uncharacterized protein n=1 Tax=Porphyra umbilicalis TaxID=2786 RepID=A0A1X6P0G8_PORUM|nr:hypothetical protein BU14_0292s0012 [Porphyra umbilicalis]|eukprot:OSX74369.1 hypothetical protein BU14_0292s0012 [Porphyra umbilicalis]